MVHTFADLRTNRQLLRLSRKYALADSSVAGQPVRIASDSRPARIVEVVREQSGWPERVARVVAAEVRRYRQAQGWSGQRLVDRCRELGLEVTRSTLGDFESGRRTKVTVAELLVLARALEVAPLQLIVPVGHEETAELLPGEVRPAWDSARWVSGELNVWELEADTSRGSMADARGAREPVSAFLPLPAFRHHDHLVRVWYVQRSEPLPSVADDDPELALRVREMAAARLQQVEDDLRWIRGDMRRKDLLPPDLPVELEHVDPRPPIPGPSPQVNNYRPG